VVAIPEAFSGVEGYKATEEQVLKVLDKNTKGLCPVLSKRLDSLFASTLGCLTSFKISNMFQFYIATIVELLGDKANLSDTLKR
jgi:Conserved oligomeric complex COG6